MSKSPTSFNSPGRKTLAEADIEGVANALLALSREVWVLIDRLAATEAVLAARGIDIREDIENFTPDATLRKELDGRGATLVDNVLRAMAGVDGEDDSEDDNDARGNKG
ncbi:MAG: hypothetical protein AB8B57_06640 [Congregibacter sp.]